MERKLASQGPELRAPVPGESTGAERVLHIKASSAASAIALGMLVENLEAGKPIEFVSLGIELVREGDELVIKNSLTGEVIDKLGVDPKPI